MNKSSRYIFALWFFLISAAYYFTGIFGLSLGQVNSYATSIWPPSGIALVAILLGGYRYLPSIFLGAFAVNYSIAGNLKVAIPVGIGSTLEVFTAVALIRHCSPNFSPKLHRLRDVMSLIFYGSIVSTLVAATIGAASLWAFANAPHIDFWQVWRTWWLGDLQGDLLCASFLMVWISGGIRKFRPAHALEFLLLILFVVCTLVLVYHQPSEPSGQVYPTSYAVFPLMIWAALRFEQWGTVTVSLLITVLTVYYTASGIGPYSNDSPERSFFFLQTFHAVVSCSGMILASVMMEKKFLYKKAQEAIQAREDFLTIASHELRTPITLLHMNLQRIQRVIMKRPSPGEVESEILCSIKSSKVSSIHLVSMIDSLLDVSKLRTGKLELNRQSMSLLELIKGVVRSFEEFAEQHETKITLQVGEDLLVGEWDRERIEQVLMNLLSNAMKYGEKKEIRVSAKNQESKVEFSVQDQGLGIAEEMQTKIFERFERAVSYSNISGLGLGLYISKQIVEAHEGTITVQSELGRGACFTVVLPK
ncbi:MAG: MASE1 domain-containing protein, partial [Bdellovibrionales bacterium]|nr:MASE1 domain-containing protein [Oligoflexia bacterium]